MSKSRMHTMASRPVSQRGVTLIELMVAMVISLIIMSGVIKVYVDQFSQTRYQESMAVVQENGRFALDLISNDLRMAGYAGCFTSDLALNNTLNGGFDASDFELGNALLGWEGGASLPGSDAVPNVDEDTDLNALSTGDWSTSPAAGTTLPAGLNGIPNSDVLRLWGGSSSQATITNVPGNGSNAETVVDLDDASAFLDDQIVILTDCEHGDIVQSCNVNTSSNRLTLSDGCTPGNDVPDGLSVQAGGSAMALNGTIYYVSKRDPTSFPGLFKATIGIGGNFSNPVELVRGIESMQIVYGVRTSPGSPGADLWVPATAVSDWNNVVSVQVSLLAVSEDDTVLRTSTQDLTLNEYTFNGSVFRPADRRMRRVFTKTVSLRNRVLGDFDDE